MDATVQEKLYSIRSFSAMTGKLDKAEYALQGIGTITDFGVKYKKYGVGNFITGLLTAIRSQRAKLNDDAGAKAADNGIKAINEAK